MTTVEEQLKGSFNKSLGMFSLVPPVLATGAVVTITSKTFKDLEKSLKK